MSEVGTEMEDCGQAQRVLPMATPEIDRARMAFVDVHHDAGRRTACGDGNRRPEEAIARVVDGAAIVDVWAADRVARLRASPAHRQYASGSSFNGSSVSAQFAQSASQSSFIASRKRSVKSMSCPIPFQPPLKLEAVSLDPKPAFEMRTMLPAAHEAGSS
jgi:hypothetical protein